MLIRGRALFNGKVSGSLLKLSEPLSLWGGVNLQNSRIVDTTHPQRGDTVEGRLLAMRGSRGSSSSSSALVELARSMHAPAGIITTRADPILIIGALVTEYLYALVIPILVIDENDFDVLPTGVIGHLWCEEVEAVLTIPP